MTAPRRIQRKRTKGWRMPEGAVYVGRPSKFGNPFVKGEWISRDDPLAPFVRIPGGWGALNAIGFYRNEQLVECYEELVYQTPWLFLAVMGELPGKDLVCWCPLDQPCHADVLLALANAEEPS